MSSFLLKQMLSSLDFMVNRFFIKLFTTNDKLRQTIRALSAVRPVNGLDIVARNLLVLNL